MVVAVTSLCAFVIVCVSFFPSSCSLESLALSVRAPLTCRVHSAVAISPLIDSVAPSALVGSGVGRAATHKRLYKSSPVAIVQSDRRTDRQTHAYTSTQTHIHANTTTNTTSTTTPNLVGCLSVSPAHCVPVLHLWLEKPTEALCARSVTLVLSSLTQTWTMTHTDPDTDKKTNKQTDSHRQTQTAPSPCRRPASARRSPPCSGPRRSRPPREAHVHSSRPSLTGCASRAT
jgi:hypothetical protein